MDRPQGRRIPQHEQWLALLIEHLKGYAIFSLDPEGHVATWNAAAERVKGYTAAEIVGQPITRFYTEEDCRTGKPHKLLRRAATEGRAHDEGWRLRKGGVRFWADVVITALRDHDGRLVGFGKVTRDLTEDRRGTYLFAILTIPSSFGTKGTVSSMDLVTRRR